MSLMSVQCSPLMLGMQDLVQGQHPTRVSEHVGRESVSVCGRMFCQSSLLDDF